MLRASAALSALAPPSIAYAVIRYKAYQILDYLEACSSVDLSCGLYLENIDLLFDTFTGEESTHPELCPIQH